jgi:hypothetical protein
MFLMKFAIFWDIGSCSTYIQQDGKFYNYRCENLKS